MSKELLEKLVAIEASFEGKAPWSEYALSSGIRHVSRNTDIFEDAAEEDGGNYPGRYDGAAIARLRNLLPEIIDALARPGTEGE